MSGTRPGDRFGLAAVGGIDRHPLEPVFEIAILDDQRDRTADRAPEADARDHPHLVALDCHPSAPSVALLAAREVVVDLREIDVEAGRVAFHHRHQFRAVRFTGCQETQHLETVRRRRRRLAAPAPIDSTRVGAAGKAGPRRRDAPVRGQSRRDRRAIAHRNGTMLPVTQRKNIVRAHVQRVIGARP